MKNRLQKALSNETWINHKIGDVAEIEAETVNLKQKFNMETKATITNQTPPFGKQMLADAVCRPILFSTPMVQSVLNGSKTQTRRLFKAKGGQSWYTCPYGQVGDILWVRESFYEPMFEGLNGKYYYKADLEKQGWDFKWKPSLFMPKDACRLFLEITDIRIERLQKISDEDCKSEGIKREIFTPTGEEFYYFYPCNDLRDDSYLDSPKTSFYSLWKSINGQLSWDDNPFVWVISFKVVERPYGFR